jgi:hypothetical protein
MTAHSAYSREYRLQITSRCSIFYTASQHALLGGGHGVGSSPLEGVNATCNWSLPSWMLSKTWPVPVPTTAILAFGNPASLAQHQTNHNEAELIRFVKGSHQQHCLVHFCKSLGDERICVLRMVAGTAAPMSSS